MGTRLLSVLAKPDSSSVLLLVLLNNRQGVLNVGIGPLKSWFALVSL